MAEKKNNNKFMAFIMAGSIMALCLPLDIKADDDILLNNGSQEIIQEDNKIVQPAQENAEILNDIKPLKSSAQPDIKIESAKEHDSNMSYINKQRKKRGLKTLKFSQRLYDAALIRAKEQRQLISHTRPSGKAWNTIDPEVQGGEIIAFYVNDIKTAVTMWDQSPAHADLLWDKEYKTAAVAKVDDFFVMEFGY